jgi:hypothetical protein
MEVLRRSMINHMSFEKGDKSATLQSTCMNSLNPRSSSVSLVGLPESFHPLFPFTSNILKIRGKRNLPERGFVIV